MNNPMNGRINGRKLLLSVATAAALFAGTAMAGDIYRYTDDDGNVVYLDRPTSAPGGVRINITSRPTDNAAIQARTQARADNAVTAEERRQARVAEEQVRADDAAAKQEQDDRCQIARNRMETLVTSRRLFREDDNGERVYLDEAQIQQARDKVQAQIEDSCG